MNRETGAIVLDDKGALVMRLSREEAERIADALEPADDAGEPESG